MFWVAGKPLCGNTGGQRHYGIIKEQKKFRMATGHSTLRLGGRS